MVYQKTAQMTRPGPSKLWSARKHPDSNNDSGMAVQIAEYSSLGDAWIDIPNNLHDGACAFSFADGHSEMHKWRGLLMSSLVFVQNGSDPSCNYEGISQPIVRSSTDLQDLNWIQARTSAPLGFGPRISPIMR